MTNREKMKSEVNESVHKALIKYSVRSHKKQDSAIDDVIEYLQSLKHNDAHTLIKDSEVLNSLKSHRELVEAKKQLNKRGFWFRKVVK